MSIKNTAPSTGFLGKYRSLALSITTLILLVISLLLLNLFFSEKLQSSNNTTDIAGKQGALVQQMSKDLLIITLRFQKLLHYGDDKDTLKDTMDLFDATLNAFADGGEVTFTDIESGLEEKTLSISKITTPETIAIILEAKEIWRGYIDKVYLLFNTEENTHTDLFWANDYAENNNGRLTELMITLTEQLRNQGEKNLEHLRIAQIVGIILAVSMFFFTIFRIVRNLQENDKQLESARQETVGIMNTIREGLFLLNDELIISGQYSNETEAIFETTDIGQQKFTELMSSILSPAELETAKEFIKLLFNPHVILDLTTSLNPLERLEVNLTREDGSNIIKYLNFSFYQVMQDEVIQDVLVSIRDITDEVLLQEQLKNTKEKSEQQVEMLMSLLHANPRLLKRFLQNARTSLNNMNNILKERVSDNKDFKMKADRLFIEIHRMKGEASAMNIKAFAEKAHAFEGQLVDLRRTEYIEGLDFLPLAIRLDKLIQYNDSLSELLLRISNYSITENSTANTQIGGDSKANGNISPIAQSQTKSTINQWLYLNHMAEKIANDMGKQVNFIMSGLNETDLNETYSDLVNDISIQLIRNSVVHGIEEKSERKTQEKNEIGLIKCNVSQESDGSIKLLFRDDGRGLNMNKMRHKIVEKGLSSHEKVSSWSEDKIVKAAFLTGFSTAEETNMHAGRGIGLNVILDKVKGIGGQLKLRQKANEFCEFEIVLPPQQSQSA